LQKPELAHEGFTKALEERPNAHRNAFWLMMRTPIAPAATVMPNLDFTLTGDYVELHNLLKITGLADSGGSAKQMVAEGAVTVDGRVELRKTCKIRAGQVVLLGDTRIAVHEA
jgi:ribosome-associated protein